MGKGEIEMINNKYIKLLMEDNNIIEGEEFNVKTKYDILSDYNPHKIIDNQLTNKNNSIDEYTLAKLFTKRYTIEKLPFVPKENEIFWYINSAIECGYDWRYVYNTEGKRLLSRGVTPYRTKTEVEKEVERLGWEYD